MTTIQIELPDTTAKAAQAAGLLAPQVLDRLLREAVQRKAVDELFEKMDELADANFPPMTMDEIQAEVEAVRTERRRRAGGA